MERHSTYLALAILAAGFAVPAAAQAQSREPGNVVGGVSAAAYGAGDNMTIEYSTGGAGAGEGTRAQTGRITARIARNDGDGPQVEHLAPLPSGVGRHARLGASGDGPEVVYLDR